MITGYSDNNSRRFWSVIEQESVDDRCIDAFREAVAGLKHEEGGVSEGDARRRVLREGRLREETAGLRGMLTQ